jgi:hypothetical protein
MSVGPMSVAWRQLTEQIAFVDKAVRCERQTRPGLSTRSQPLKSRTFAPANDYRVGTHGPGHLPCWQADAP